MDASEICEEVINDSYKEGYSREAKLPVCTPVSTAKGRS